MSLEDRKWHIEQCIRCHNCKFIPIAKSQKYSTICPAIQYGEFHAYSGSGKIITAYGMMTGRAGYSEEVLESLTTCSMCGACDTTCNTLLERKVAPMDTLYEIRAKIVSDGKSLKEHDQLIANLVDHGNVFGKPRSERSLWAAGLTIKDAGEEAVDVLLHIGCQNAYDEGRWASLVAIVGVLEKAGVKFGILGNNEIDAGGLAYEMGYRDVAKKLAEESSRVIRASRAATLVTCCADSLAAFRNYHPRMGVSMGAVQVFHITEYLEKLMTEGRFAVQCSSNETVTYHDPCRLGRLSEAFTPWSGKWKEIDGPINRGMAISDPPAPKRFGRGGVYDAPRNLLRKVSGVRFVEMERVREFSYCCGAGGGGEIAHPQFAEKAAMDRLDEAASTGATTLVSACAGCIRHLGAAARNHASNIKVKGLIDFITESLA